MYSQCVLALLLLYVGLAHSFSWDIVLGGPAGLNFYNGGKLTHSAHMPSSDIQSVIYDPVHNKVLFSDRYKITGIYSFDLVTKKIQSLVKCESDFKFKFAYDPVTETVFWITYERIYSYSLTSGSGKKVDGNLLFKLDLWGYGIAVDSCGGYIYWTTDRNIERARFDGSERQVIIDNMVAWRQDLAIDQQTQKLYWIEIRYEYKNSNDVYTMFIEYADLNGKNRNTLYSEKSFFEKKTITVSKDFVYWRSRDEDTFKQLSKNLPHQYPIAHTDFCNVCNNIAANYKLEDQIRGSRTCKALIDVNLFCVHGTKFIGESACKCTQGYTGARCEVLLCENYCFQGNCSVSDEQPKCRCNAGYSGERCEVDACHKHCLNNGVCTLNADGQPVCECTGDYNGERCDISVCRDYCFQGNCSVSADGQPKCRCNAGYSGERCGEVDACHKHCLNNGVCSLNEENEPVCKCTGDYEGERCEVSVSVFFTKCYRTAPTLSTLRDILNTDVAPVTLEKEVLQLLSENNEACFRDEL